MDHSALSDNISKKDLTDMINIIERHKIPDSILDKTIKIATWNIQRLGKSRKPRSIHYLAEVLSRFELIAIIELRESTKDLEKIMKILGPYWKVIYSDSNMDDKGNGERIGYLYDGRVVEFTGLAAEADPIRENFATEKELEKRINTARIDSAEREKLIEIIKNMDKSHKLDENIEIKLLLKKIDNSLTLKKRKYVFTRIKKTGKFIATVNWWRSPYLVSFKAGNFDFMVLAAHMRWGDGSKQAKEGRRVALEKLADWVKKRREQKAVKDKDIIVLGDFNITGKNTKLWEAITKNGLDTHSSIISDKHGSTISPGKRYDQIFYHSENKHRVKKGGIVNLYPTDSDKIYKTMNKKEFKREISDHFALWIQLDVEER